MLRIPALSRAHDTQHKTVMQWMDVVSVKDHSSLGSSIMKTARIVDVNILKMERSLLLFDGRSL